MSEKEGGTISSGAMVWICLGFTALTSVAWFFIGRLTGRNKEADGIGKGGEPVQTVTQTSEAVQRDDTLEITKNKEIVEVGKRSESIVTVPQSPVTVQQDDVLAIIRRRKEKLLMGIMVAAGGICAFISSSALKAIRRFTALLCVEAAKGQQFIWICPTADLPETKEIMEMNRAAAKRIDFLDAEMWIGMLEELRLTVKDEILKCSWYELFLNGVLKIPSALFKSAKELPEILEDNKSVISQLLKIPLDKMLASRERAMKKANVVDEAKVGPLWLFELIASLTDYSVVIDSFSSLVKTTTKIGNNVVMDVMKPFFGTGKNLFLLHCENKNGGPAGGDGFGELLPSTVSIQQIGKDTYAFEETNGTSLRGITCVAKLNGSESDGYWFSECDDDDVATVVETKPVKVADQILAVIGVAEEKRLTRGQVYAEVNGAKGTIDKELHNHVKDSKVSITKALTGRNDSDDDVFELIV
jgi:hypothetical protein